MRIRIATIFLTALIAITGAASAQSTDSALSVDLLLNHNEAGDHFDRWYDDEFGGGVGLTYMYNKYVGVRGSANYFKFTRDHEGADFGMIRINLDGRIAYPVMDELRVFGQAGMGLYLWDADTIWWSDIGPEDGADIGYKWGFGAQYDIVDNISLVASWDQHSVELEDTNHRFKWTEISLGVAFHLDPLILGL